MIELNKKTQQYADMWFARSRDGFLYIYKAKPLRDEEHGEWEELELEENYEPFFLYKDYPDISWENSPIKLEDYFRNKFIEEASIWIGSHLVSASTGGAIIKDFKKAMQNDRT